MLNTLTIYFQPCVPAPSGGYLVKYRPLGTDEEYRVSDPVFSSPVVINDTNDPDPTSYEGFIYSDCGNGVFSDEVPFDAINPDADSQSDIDGSESDASQSVDPGNCSIFGFAVFGGDSDIWSINATNCDGTPYVASGFVGDGNPPPRCLRNDLPILTGGSPIVPFDTGVPCS